MIAVNMGESHLSFVSLFPHVTGTNKTLRNFKRKHRNKKRTGTDRHLNAHIHKHPCFSLSPVRSLVVTPKFILRTFAHLSLHEKERRDEREKLVCVCVCELRTITFRWTWPEWTPRKIRDAHSQFYSGRTRNKGAGERIFYDRDRRGVREKTKRCCDVRSLSVGFVPIS